MLEGRLSGHEEGGGGKIINIGSMASLFGGAKLMAYGASKGGIVAMTRALAVAWAPDNIQVNAILPGWIDTDLTRRARVELEGLNERVLARTPMVDGGDPTTCRALPFILRRPRQTSSLA
jgi:2-deoxy-D-gluconate 3-dehydrogenase